MTGFVLNTTTSSDYVTAKYAPAVTGIHDPALASAPRLAWLGALSPNPLVREGTVEFTLSGNSPVTLELYDPRARSGGATAAGGNSGGGGTSAASGDGLPSRFRALVEGSGSGPGGRRTRGDRRRSAKLRELEELAANIAALDHRAASLAGRIRSLRRRVESAYNPHWGSVFREGNEIVTSAAESGR